MSSPDPTPEPDSLERLPRRVWASVALVLAVSGLNAFNDNILKMMLIGLAPKVAQGALGQEIGAWLGAMILLPFVIFAPLSGYFSDRYSKRRVIFAMLIAQSAILLTAAVSFQLAWGNVSVLLALGSFFLLATQSTFFSPAKMGILKELVGSRRLGMVSGWMQMVTMVGILGGLGAGGAWFDTLYTASGNPWSAAAWPIGCLFGVSLIALISGLAIQKTPAHPEVRYRHALWWEHFSHLKESLSQAPMRRAFLGNSTYWFVASMAAAMFVDIGLALHPDPGTGGAASAASLMTLMVGLGTVTGSLFVAWVNRNTLQLGLIPLGALGLALTLIWAGATSVETASFNWALAAIGFTGGCYMVPIQTFIQDRANPERRGRVLASMNLLDSVAGVSGVAFLILLKAFNFDFRDQFWLLAALMLGAALYIIQLLPNHLLRLLLLAIIRTMYRIRAVHRERVPASGGVLLLPNHVSYVDAIIIGAANLRQVRFVMWEALYRLWWLNNFLRIVGTVPISSTRAKDAVRSVATALKDQRIVCLFPEGQITRHGMINELRKGFELMARQGEAQVVPVYLDGLYGSIFSYQGGVCFKKWPKRLRYPVSVYFGHPLPAHEATTERIRHQLYQLSCEALLAHPELSQPGRSAREQQILANALRLMEVEWARKGDTLLCLAPPDSVLSQTMNAYVRLRSHVTLITDTASLHTCAPKSVIAIGGVDLPQQLAPLPHWHACGRYAMSWTDASTRLDSDTSVLPGLIDPITGALLAISVPDPNMPAAEQGAQPGSKPGSFGRLLPGLRYESTPQELRLSGLIPDSETSVCLPGMQIDEAGFLMPRSDENAVPAVA